MEDSLERLEQSSQFGYWRFVYLRISAFPRFSCPSTNATDRDSSSDDEPSGERPRKSFTCSVCRKTLSSKHALGLHERTVHLGVRDHPCALCPHRAKQSANLQRHTWSHHCPDKLMEQLIRERRESGAPAPSPVTAWKEAVETRWEQLWVQLSARNQEYLSAQRKHFRLLAQSEEILGLDGKNEGSPQDKKKSAFPMMDMVALKPLPVERLPKKQEESAERNSSTALTPLSTSRRRRPRKIQVVKKQQAEKPEKENGCEESSQESDSAEVDADPRTKPCRTCSLEHDEESFHPMAELMREAEKKSEDSEGDLLKCRMCLGRFACEEPFLLSLHQAYIHSFRPAHHCADCQQVTSSTTDLALHRWKSHGTPCPLCDPEDEDEPVGEDLLHRTDLTRALRCELCPAAFLSGDHLSLALHLLESHTQERFWKACCNLCPRRFLRREDWGEHVRWAHQGGKPKDGKRS